MKKRRAIIEASKELKKIIYVIGAVMITGACTLPASLAVNLPIPATYVQAAVTLSNEGTCGDTATYTYAAGVLTISGTGSIENNAFKENKQITKVVIQNGITEIGESAFEGCSALSEIIIPDSVTVIESTAFASSGLQSLTLPSALTKLGACILEKNTGVKEVTIPATVVTMRENNRGYNGAFYGSAVETLTFRNGIKTIPEMACHGATHLTAVSIPNSVTVIGESAFSECSALSEISIPDSVTVIESEAFVSTGLTRLTLPKGLTKLGACILEKNTGVKEVTVPSTIVTMRGNNRGYHGAFYGSAVEILTFESGLKTVPAMACHGMEKVTTVVIPASVTKFEEDVFNEVGSGIVVRAYTGSYAMSYVQKLGIPTYSIGQCVVSKITASNVTKVTSKKAIVFSLNAKTTGKGTLYYKSNNSSVTVNAAGKVTIAKNFVGTAKITITVDTVAEYLGTSKEITITVKPASVKLKKLKRLKEKGKMTVTWAKNTNSSGFEVQYATDKKFTKNTKKVSVKGSSKTSTTLKSLKQKKTYFVRVRTYKTTAGGKIFSDWSNVKKLKM